MKVKNKRRKKKHTLKINETHEKCCVDQFRNAAASLVHHDYSNCVRVARPRHRRRRRRRFFFSFYTNLQTQKFAFIEESEEKKAIKFNLCNEFIWCARIVDCGAIVSNVRRTKKLNQVRENNKNKSKLNKILLLSDIVF